MPRRLLPALTTGVLALAVAAAAQTVASAPASAATPTTYYVDAASGSDTAAGTSPTTAWRSLAKINATTFAPGDRILLHGGQTWVGQLHPQGSGAAGAPITLSSYGSGRPVVDGSTSAGGGAVELANQQYWTITGLEVTNTSPTDNFDQGTRRSGIQVETTDAYLTGITISDNLVHDVNGCFRCTNGDGHFNGGIAVIADVLSWNGISTGSFSNVTISGNTVSHVGRTGIIFGDYSAGWSVFGTQQIDPGLLSDNITITGNRVSDVDSDGIVAQGLKNSRIDHNVVARGGLRYINDNAATPSAAGIWPCRSIDVTVEYNEVYGMKTDATDGQGFDIDHFAQRTTVQYNYSHDNEGGFLLIMGGDYVSNAATVRYNLSVNDAFTGQKGVFTFAYGNIPNTTISNNTVYIPAGSKARPIFGDGGGLDLGALAWRFTDNIVANYGTGTWSSPYGSGRTVDHNLFAGNHTDGELPDATVITADPQFVAPSATAPLGRDNVGGYRVATTSPAVRSGALISDNGGRDYFGNAVSATAAPTRGFHEAATT